jgi:8-oxo-dGTP diphosphatase
MPRMHVCTGLLERDGRVLVVGNQYPNHATLLWNLPGGRQERNETVAMAVARELREETGLEVRVGALAYVAESFDPPTDTHVVVFCFAVTADGEPAVPAGDAHVRDCRFVAYDELPELLRVPVIRDPLMGHLADRERRYFGYLDAGVTIAFADAPVARAATPLDASDRAPHRRDAPE